MGYITSKLGLDYPQPIELEVDNATAITVSKGAKSGAPSFDTCIDARQAWVEALCDENIAIVKLTQAKVDTHMTTWPT